jgi:hypothetical protein
MDIDHMAHLPRWLAGACGGIAACLAQCLGQNQAQTIAGYIGHAEWTNAGIQLMAIFIGLLILMALASLVAVFSNEQNRQKLFAMGVAVPALATTAFPGVQHFAQVFTPAYAAESTQSSCDQSGQITLGKGLKSFFGIDDPRYRVVVGSFKKIDDAKALAAKVNADDPSAKATVGEKAPCNDFYPVAVGNGDYFSVDQAKRLQSKVLQYDSVNGAYLSPER